MANIISTRAEWWRARAGELACDAICPSKDRAATLAVDRSRSLILSGGLAQPCSSARLVVHALLEHLRLLPAELENLRHARSVPQIFLVRGAASDAREHSMYRKTDLEHSARKLQISAT